MSSRVAVAGIALVGVGIGFGAYASADSGELVASLPTTPPVSVSLPSGGDTGGGGAEGGGADVPERCNGSISPWQLYTPDSAPGGLWVPPGAVPEGSQGPFFDGMQAEEEAGYDQVFIRQCGNGVEFASFGAEPPPPTVDDLWPGAYDDAVSQIPLPIPEVAPPVVQGSLVNAPLWLAVSPPVPVSARAQVGAVWAQVDAMFVGLTWDMGVPDTDDDVVECHGPGEIWEGFSPTEDPWQVPECGWNYEQPSTPENTGTDNSWYDISVTEHWELRLTGSDGRDVALDPIDVPIEFDYVVYEWQTVGTG